MGFFLSRNKNDSSEKLAPVAGRVAKSNGFSETKPPELGGDSGLESAVAQDAIFMESLVKECAIWRTFAQKSLDNAKDRGRIHRVTAMQLDHALHRMQSLLEMGHFFAHWSDPDYPPTDGQIELHTIIEEALEKHIPQFKSRNQTVRRKLKPVTAMADPELTRALVKYVIAWAADSGHRLDFRLATKTWPAEARWIVKCTVEAAPAAETYTSAFKPAQPDGIGWLLLKHLAELGGMGIDSVFGGIENVVIITFPQVVQQIEGISVMEVDADGHGQTQQMSFESNPISGARVMIICPDARMRVRIRDALRAGPFEVDTAGSIQQAMGSFVIEQPEAIIITEDLVDDQFFEMRDQILNAESTFPFIVIRNDDESFEISGPDNESACTVSAQQMERHLVPALLLELSKSF